MKQIGDWEAVIGLEVHVELKTKTKMFCNCKTDPNALPNSLVCPVCLGMPGALPVMNRHAVELAVRAGLVTDSKISLSSQMARKNYFYPDLPKAYQISQYDRPLCTCGSLEIDTENGKKQVGITRIHMEEDAGKLFHSEENGTLIDCNRCGVPLIEIVSEPDMRSGEEAKSYLQKLCMLMVYAGISDCKMNEGQLRCDVNISVRHKGETALGTRTEIKNINSFQFVQRAIENEYERQIAVIESGGRIVRETRRFDGKTQKNSVMRTKESADDYRFFDEPDILSVLLKDEDISAQKKALPMMPDERAALYMQKYNMPEADCRNILSDMEVATYFEKCAEKSKYPRHCANIILTEILGIMEANDTLCKIEAAHIAALADLLGDGEINSATEKKLIKEMWKADFDPVKKIDECGMRQINDQKILRKWVLDAIEENPQSVADYISGKHTAMKAIMGKAMAKSGGRAAPHMLNEILQDELSKL